MKLSFCVLSDSIGNNYSPTARDLTTTLLFDQLKLGEFDKMKFKFYKMIPKFNQSTASIALDLLTLMRCCRTHVRSNDVCGHMVVLTTSSLV